PDEGSVSFTNVNLNLADSQDTYVCVLLKASTVSSGQPESLANVNIDSITIDKLLDQSGQTISAVAANLTIATALGALGVNDADDFFFKGVPTIAVQNLPTVVLPGTGSVDVMRFVAGSNGSVNDLNQLLVTYEG